MCARAAPIDTIKTRIQRATALPGETAWSRVTTVAGTMFREEGVSAFYSARRCLISSRCLSQLIADDDAIPRPSCSTEGITPRVARVAPGQAVVFAVYEKVKKYIDMMVR